MKKRKFVYNCINFVVIVCAAIFFTRYYVRSMSGFEDMNWAIVILLVIAVIMVHIIKSARLYLALYGYGITFDDYIKTYCKVTPVSMVFPFKSGELFRMYCYGVRIGSILKGIVIIMIDRFMDTVALVAAIWLTCFFVGGTLSVFDEFLMFFLGFSLMVYFAFPGLYRFWKQYLLKASASEKKLCALKLLDTIHKIYYEVENVAKGRGMLMLFLSVIAWTIEIGCVILMNKWMGIERGEWVVSSYLSAAMSAGTSVYLKQVVFVSTLLLLMVYVLIKIGEMISKKRDKHESNCYL